MPHCDTLDGPVVKAAKKALETGNINHVLIWVPERAEEELKEAFEKVSLVRTTCVGLQEGVDLAEYWFFETTVRLHRAGEGEPFTGLKPAGLDEGPVVPKAEKAIETGNADVVIDFAKDAVGHELKERFEDVVSKKNYDVNDVKAGREYIEAYINFVVFSHHLYVSLKGEEGHNEEVKHG